MDHIPDRENLRSMSRIDIQKLCKNNNIKANMRTDELINALCDLVNGEDVPCPYRTVSGRVVSRRRATSRLSSAQPAPKTAEISAKKTAFQQSESNTDAESVADIPASAPATRRKTKDLQAHLGKGRPMNAGGSGASALTRVISRGTGRKGKASAMLQEDRIPEEDEAAGSPPVPTDQHLDNLTTATAAPPPSVQPLSSTTRTPTGSNADNQPPHLPTSTPSQLSSTQLATLERRVAYFETLNVAARLSELETSLAIIPTLRESVAQIPSLPEVRRLEGTQGVLESDVARCTQANAQLEARASNLEGLVKNLLVENGTLREHIKMLHTQLHDLVVSAKDNSPSMSSMIIHSQGVKPSVGSVKDKGKGVETLPVGIEKDAEEGKDVEEGKDAEEGKDVEEGRDAEEGSDAEIAVGADAAPRTKFVVFSQDPDLPDPSPVQPNLGKRARRPTDTPDGDGVCETTAATTQKRREDGELAALHRLINPQRKKPRLDSGMEVPPFSFFQHGIAGPSSTSTPHQRQSRSPLGFFTEGRRAPTPLARTADDAELMASLDVDEFVVQEVDTLKSEAVAGPSIDDPTSSADASPRTPPPKPAHQEATNNAENRQGTVHDAHEPGFFGGHLPDYYTHSPQLPFPLHLTTPRAPNPSDELERQAQFATPTLGEAWKFTANPAGISHLVDGIEQPGTPGSPQSLALSHAGPLQSPGDFAFRAGRRKERDNKYNPYFTPPRGPDTRYRTGITPTHGVAAALGSPATMESVPEGHEGETGDGVVRSPPHLRTLYGTELGGDTRFGDYGRDLGRFDWGKYLPR